MTRSGKISRKSHIEISEILIDTESTHNVADIPFKRFINIILCYLFCSCYITGDKGLILPVY